MPIAVLLATLTGTLVQAALAGQSNSQLFGWKIAATSEAGQKHINVAGPQAGRIFSERVIADGGTAPMAGNEMAVGEPEFAFRMGRSLPPRSMPYSIEDVLAAVDTLHPAIEIPDSRYDDFTQPFQDFITRYAWGEIWNRPGLSRAERSLITLSALATLSRDEELALHLRAALRNGLSIDQIRELFMHLAVYAGVPAANHAFAIARKVFGRS